MKIYPVFVPLSFGCAPKIARQQGVIKSNENGFAELLEKELERLSPKSEPAKKNQKVKEFSFSGNSTTEDMWEETRCFYI
jgi:hypothetical protein